MTTDMANPQMLQGLMAQYGGDLFAAHMMTRRAKGKKSVAAANLAPIDDGSLRNITALALGLLRETQAALDEANARITLQQEHISRLESLAATDMLTGLTNRRGFMEAFERELDRTRRGHTKGGLLIMIDLDNFKTINDTYGHAAGDEALKLVSQTLSAAVRKMDVAGRMGGDEFVLLFSNADILGAVERAQQLAMRLNSLVLRHQGERIPVRASIGMKAYTGEDSIEAVFAAADEKMYAVKNRNRKEQKAEGLSAQYA